MPICDQCSRSIATDSAIERDGVLLCRECAERDDRSIDRADDIDEGDE